MKGAIDNPADVAGEIAAHAALTTGVHGVGAGTIVGTTLAQVLTNKTLTAPVINGVVITTGLTFDAGSGDIQIITTGSVKGLEIEGSNDEHGPRILLDHTDTTPTAGNWCGRVDCSGFDGAGTPAAFVYGLFGVIHDNVGDTTEEGKFAIFLATGGVANNNVLNLSGAGVLDVDASSGLGAAVVGEFDLWNDIRVLDRAVKNQEFGGLVEMGVFSKKNTGSGYMMNLQAAHHLSWSVDRQLATAIDYLVDTLSDEFPNLRKKLQAKRLMALPQGGQYENN